MTNEALTTLCVLWSLRSDPAGGACSQWGAVHHPAAPAADPPAAADAAWWRAGAGHTTGTPHYAGRNTKLC